MKTMREIRKAAGLTLEELGEAVGTSRQQIWKLENGIVKMSKEWAERLAPSLKCSPLDLLYPNRKDQAVLPAPELSGYLAVKGSVQAGAWIELDFMGQDEEPTIPIGADPRFPSQAQFVLKVVGESTNRTIKDGEFAVALDLRETGGEAKSGDLVVVERVRKDAGLVETTIKRLRSNGVSAQLWPESDDPRYQKPIEISNGEQGVVVQIVAKVIGKYSPL